MTQIRQKRPRVKLKAAAYRKLCREVLERDGWRCQICGRKNNLQVHHVQWRSRLGNDTKENLIALCAVCHRLAHLRMYRYPYEELMGGLSANERQSMAILFWAEILFLRLPHLAQRAAKVDAFRRVVIPARVDKGQSPARYFARFQDRLAQCGAGQAEQFAVRLAQIVRAAPN